MVESLCCNIGRLCPRLNFVAAVDGLFNLFFSLFQAAEVNLVSDG